MTSKGLATREIVLIVVGLIVLGVIVTLIYVGVGPFRCSVQYNKCKAQYATWCTGGAKGSFVADECTTPIPGCTYDTFPSDSSMCDIIS